MKNLVFLYLAALRTSAMEIESCKPPTPASTLFIKSRLEWKPIGFEKCHEEYRQEAKLFLTKRLNRSGYLELSYNGQELLKTDVVKLHTQSILPDGADSLPEERNPKEITRSALRVWHPTQGVITQYTLIDTKNHLRIEDQRGSKGRPEVYYELAEDYQPAQILVSITGFWSHDDLKPSSVSQTLPTFSSPELGSNSKTSDSKLSSLDPALDQDWFRRWVSRGLNLVKFYTSSAA